MIINDCNLPKPIYDAMVANTYNPGKVDYSASSVVYGPKEYWGKKLLKDHNQLASKLWAAFTGTLMHLGLEYFLSTKYYYNGEELKVANIINLSVEEFIELQKNVEIVANNYKQEMHIEINFNEVSKHHKLEQDRIIGGTIDLLDFVEHLKKYVLYDYKTMSTTSLILDDKIKEWTEKANWYMYCLENSGYRLADLIYLPIFKDWTTTKAMRSGSVEDVPCPSIKLDKWTREQCERWIVEKISYIEKFRDVPYDQIPYCTAEQRWEKHSVFKVCKEKNGVLGKALPGCTFATVEEAVSAQFERQAKDKKGEIFGVKKTGGTPVKCKDWCVLSQNGICDYMQKHGED